MRQETINLYSFEELSIEAKEKAVESLQFINVEHEWWDSVYDDARNVGLKITSFDIDRASYAVVEAKDDFIDVARCILKDWGEECDMHKIASEYVKEWDLWSSTVGDTEWGDSAIENLDEIDQEFKNQLSEYYLASLRKECDWRCSESEIIETIVDNEYEFTIDGKMY